MTTRRSELREAAVLATAHGVRIILPNGTIVEPVALEPLDRAPPAPPDDGGEVRDHAEAIREAVARAASRN